MAEISAARISMVSYALLRANFRESSFDFSEASKRREPTFTLIPPRMAGSTRVVISGSLPSAWRSAAATPLAWAAVSGDGGGHLGRDGAAGLAADSSRSR